MDFVREIESLPFDYFEAGNYLTAGISYPDQPFLDSVQNRSRDARLVFGVCEEPRHAENFVLGSMVVRELLRQTEENTIQFWMKGVDAGAIKLHDEVRENASFIMLCSIRQALAGPHDEDTTAFIGQPVTELIDHIYRNHLNNANRAEQAEAHEGARVSRLG